MKFSALHPPAEAPEALAAAPPALVTRLAGLAPDAGQPSRAILAAALLRIPPPRRAARRQTILTLSGWATAACLAVGTGFNHMGMLPSFFPDGPPTSAERGTTADLPGNHPASPHMADGLPPEAWLEALLKPTHGAGPRRESSLNARQNMEQLRTDLSRLRAANDARFQGADGLSRTVVVEMTDPADPREAQRTGTLKLSERVAESIAAGVTAAGKTDPEKPVAPPASAPPSPAPTAPAVPQDLRLSGGDGSWSGDIVIEKGLPNAGMFNLPEGSQIKHLDFPVGDAANFRGLQDLGSGWFYDRFGDLLWQPSGQGREYLGTKAPNGFDPESFTPPSPVLPPPPQAVPEAPAPQLEAPLVETPPPETPAGAIAAVPPIRGYPIFDETTGAGSIILQNLPPSGAGESYQLWVTDPASSQPISVGLMPALEAGGGRIWFDLGGPGVAPSGYLLTLEPVAGSTSPTGRIALKGP